MAQQTIGLGTVDNDGTGDTLKTAGGKINANFTELYGQKDTDGTLAANSDSKVPSQKAVKTYVDAAVTGLFDFKGSTDASANPNYPAASKGDAYVVSVAGKVGGASGTSVDVGDVYLAKADNAGGTQAAVGTSWTVLEHNLVGALLAANNLSDVASASAARTNLGLAIGTDVQAHDTELDALAGLTSAANKLAYFTGAGTAALTDFTAAGRALVDDADAAAQRTTLGLAIGSNVQAWDADLDALAALATTPYGRALLTLANAAAADWIPKAGGTLTGALNWAAAVDVASAGTTDIGAAASNLVRVTGTTTITGLGTIAAGAHRWVRFAGVLTLTYNATSLILPGAANIATVAGDAALFVSEGSGNWRCLTYQRAAQAPLVVGSNVQAWDADLDAVAASSVAAAWTAFTPAVTSGSGTLTTASAAGSYLKLGKMVVFQMVITVTTAGTGAGALQATLPSTANSIATFAGRENAVSGKQVQGNVSAASNILSIMDYANITVIANGASVRISGFYESTT